MTTAVTFRQIEQKLRAQGQCNRGDTGLARWYQSLLDTPLDEFSDKELCIACRQELFPEYVVPWVIERLQVDIQAGDLYDGELIESLARVPRSYWRDNPPETCRLRELLERAIGRFHHEAVNTTIAILLRSFDTLLAPDPQR